MDPAEIPWGDHGVDVVIESTGIFTAREKAAGAPRRRRRAGRSSPRRAATPTPRSAWASTTTVFDPRAHTVISNASCTTNCFVPMVKVLDDAFGVEQGLMTTVHAYTSDQQLQDLAKATRSGKPDLRRMRAADLSIIPSSTGAARAIGLVLPSSKGKLDGTSLRVPGARRLDHRLRRRSSAARSPSTRSTTRSTRPPTTSRTAGVLEYSEEPLVSADIVGNPASCIFAAERHDGRRASWSRCSAGTTTSGATPTASSTSSRSSAQ